jgi:plastocyanin domain-containing protein
MKRSVSAVLLVIAVLAGCDKAQPASTAPVSSAPTVIPADGGAVVIIADEKGFTPTEVRATKGSLASLIFKRTSDNTCAKEVVFPELKIRRELPLNEAVAIQLPTQIDHTYRFQCGMAMWEGTVVVK